MDIQSITTSVGAYTSSTTQANQAQQAQQMQQVQLADRSESQVAESKEATPRPVTNTSGQETGKLINVTA